MGFKDTIREWLLDGMEELRKADADQLETKPQEAASKDVIAGKAIIDDPYFEHAASSTIYQQRVTRLSNKMLRDVSLRDWVVSAIVQARVDTMLRFSRPQKNRFEPGYKIVKRDGADYSDSDKDEVKILEDFIYHCGKTENVPTGTEMLFGEFLKLTLRDALTFGHIGVEKILTRKKALHRFRPLPGEQIYHINKHVNKETVTQQVAQAKQLMIQSRGDNDPANKFVVNEANVDYFKYVQVGYDNRVLAAFGDQDFIFKLFNPQNFGDSHGYCYSILELAIINLTSHLNVENYNTQFFTHGQASRGVLHLKGMVTQSQLAAFRRQFYNSISGVQNSWRTPIIAGLDDVKWIPMAGSAREMEYISFNDHIIRALCAQFQIDPVEIGLDYLSHPTGKSPMQQSNNEFKIEASKERGLYPIFMFFEDFVNCNLLPTIDPVLANKYKFSFVGYNDVTPQGEIAYMQAEMTVYASLNDLLNKAQKNRIDEPVADLPLNQAFWSLVEKNYTRGEIRERFFGDKGAKQRRELAYIPGDPAFMVWNELMLTISQQKKAEETQAEQLQMAKEQHEREGDVHEREGDAHEQELEHADEAHDKEMSMVEKPVSIHDTAKELGATKASHVGGQTIANPINKTE